MIEGDLSEQAQGFPAFVYRNMRDGRLNWWSPKVTGDEQVDYNTGAACFTLALDLLRDLRLTDFGHAMTVPVELCGRHASDVLAEIVFSMRAIGPVERGFLDELTRRAVVGIIPPLSPFSELSEEGREAETNARSCIELVRLLGILEPVTCELIEIIEGRYEYGIPALFVWVICVAAAAGTLQ